MREAVEYLKEQPESEYVGLCAVTNYRSKEFGFRLKASPMITLKNLIGRTPKQIWEIFDADVTSQIKYFESRFRPAGSWEFRTTQPARSVSAAPSLPG